MKGVIHLVSTFILLVKEDDETARPCHCEHFLEAGKGISAMIERILCVHDVVLSLSELTSKVFCLRVDRSDRRI
jgi:hypothetical protein